MQSQHTMSAPAATMSKVVARNRPESSSLKDVEASRSSSDYEDKYNKPSSNGGSTVTFPRNKLARWSFAAVLGAVIVLGAMATLSERFHRYDGPPSDLVVHGKRPYFAKVPLENRKKFFIPNDVKFRRTVIRAFRNRGWSKSDTFEGAHIIYTKGEETDYYLELKPWQRYNHIPGFSHWDKKDGFIKGFTAYKENNPTRPLRFLPETYRLRSKTDRTRFENRLDSGGLDQPWVLKRSDVNNGKGITMLGPQSDELKNVMKTVAEEPDERFVVQAYICNELTWFQNRKFDLRMYWMVASLDPLIVLYHDGYVRIGNAAYDETDWSSTAQHLTTHTFLSEEGKGTMENLQELVHNHYNDNRRDLSHVHVDPFEHVRNQFKEAIAETIAAFRDVTFGAEPERLSSENGFAFYGVDFVLDNDLDVWYVESQAGPGMEEEWDFRVEMHRDLLRSWIDIVDEIITKQEADPHGNLLPLESVGGWSLVYAGDWQYEYKDYKAPKEKKGCGLSETNRMLKRTKQTTEKAT